MVTVFAYLRLVRWPNLLIIGLVQYLIRFSIIESLNVPHVLSRLEYTIGVLCSISLAAAGYVVNDLYDLKTDYFNKPNRITIGKQISTNQAWFLYILLNLIAIGSGYIVATAAGFEDLWLIPVVATALLYLYAIDLKKRPVLGNLVVSLLAGLPVFFTGIFDVLPAGSAPNGEFVRSVLEVITAYSLFAAYTNFIREVIKDAEDIEGDSKLGYRTLAVLLGRQHLRYLVISLLFVLLIFTGAFNLYLFESDLYSSLYLLLFVNIPIIYLMWKIFIARSKLDFGKASTLLKIIMITGILSMVVFTLSIKSMF